MKLTNSRTGGAGRGNGQLAVLLIVICGIEMCTGQQTPEQLQQTSRAQALGACLVCVSHPSPPDCLKTHIALQQTIIDTQKGDAQTISRRVKKLLEECCDTSKGKLDKCTDDKIKEISSAGHFFTPKACLMLLSLGTLMMASLY